MILSIIIVNWNTCQMTCDCIKSIYDHAGNVEYEIILIDNASSDDSVSKIKKIFPEVILIENSENIGFGRANNQGMDIAKGKYILLLNSDTLVLDRALERAISFAEKWTDAGMIGCRILNMDKSLQPSCFMYPSLLNMILSATHLYKIFPKSRFFSREFLGHWQHNTVRKVDVIKGCFMLARSEAIAKVGKMDPDFFLYAEETDWCRRFKNSGWEILFTPSAEIVHLGGQSSKSIRPAALLQKRAGILQFIDKYHSATYYIACCFLTSLWFSLRIIPNFFLGVTTSDSDHYLRSKTFVKGAAKSLSGWKALAIKHND